MRFRPMRFSVRRVIFIAVLAFAASRLVGLAQARGFELVAIATVQVTLVSLSAWVLHMVAHELAHWAAAKSQGFVVRGVRFGPVALDFSGQRTRVRLGGDLGGGVSSLPRGTERLWVRLRRVALAGPAMTLLLTACTFVWWRVGSDGSLATIPGVFLVMGVFTLVTALMPGVVLPRRPPSGTDLEQALQPRSVKAHWLNAAALQAVLDGKPLREALDVREAMALMPSEGEVEGLELGWCFAMLDAGETERARVRLRSMVERFDEDTPEWLKTDAFNQLGVLSAFEGDVVHAQACLAEVHETQSMEWYEFLLRACIARARSENWEVPLQRWLNGANASPGRLFAFAGNQWVLDSLSRRGERWGERWGEGK